MASEKEYSKKKIGSKRVGLKGAKKRMAHERSVAPGLSWALLLITR